MLDLVLKIRTCMCDRGFLQDSFKVEEIVKYILKRVCLIKIFKKKKSPGRHDAYLILLWFFYS